MSEINVNILALEEGILNLKSLSEKCKNFDTKIPVSVGGGRTVSELEQIEALYQKLNTHLAMLAQNTASFMENVKDSYVASDEKAARGIIGSILEMDRDALKNKVLTY